jgi:protein ImuB
MSRVLLVWCPDWPVIAAGIVEGVPVHRPVAVLAANRVIACSEAARGERIRRGLRRREAQSRCPELIVLDHDSGRDARAFEPVVAAVEELAPGVELVRPGACALAARGPSRYFGSEERAAERIVEHVAQSCAVEAQVGIAEGVFAARLAARAGRLIPPGDTAAFLADLDISTVDRPDLVDLLRRLGVGTLGAFAALPSADVSARFGLDAALAQRLAAGRDERPLAVRQPPPDLDVTQTFEEPLDRVDAAAFAARKLAQRLHDRLAGHGLACTRVGIVAVTEHGEELHRTWRHDGLLNAAAIADRLRWQLDGWLSGIHPGRSTVSGRPVLSARPTAGILRLRLIPDGVLAHAGFQLGLWGDAGQERDRAHRALTRVQGMLGPEAVLTAVPGGGRDPTDQVRLVPWGDERVPGRPGGPTVPPVPPAPTGPAAPPAVGRGRAAQPPWPGRLPAPSPATVPPEPLAVEVYDPAGAPVGVTARLAVTGPPRWLVLEPRPGPATAGRGTAGRGTAGRGTPGRARGHAEAGRPPDRDGAVEVTGWAGPWPVEERWWAPGETVRRVRFQVCLADGRALLLALSDGCWWVIGGYD